MHAAVLLMTVVLTGFAQQGVPTPEQQAKMKLEADAVTKKYRDEAVRMNEIAAHIRTEADARSLVDSVAEVFAKELPPEWATSGIRSRLAHSEFKAVASGALIPEQRVADVWNEYVREIGAASEAMVTAAEIHHLRDTYYATSVRMWERGWNQSLWTMPGVYALGADGKVAAGCRPLECLRILHDLDSIFQNLRTTRMQMQQGIVVSDELKKREEKQMLDKSPQPRVETRLEARVISEADDPVRSAEHRYLQEHGMLGMTGIVLKLFNQLFPQ